MRVPEHEEARPASRDWDSGRWLAWFVEGLTADGYAKLTIDGHRCMVRKFLSWAARSRVAVTSLEPAILDRYAAALWPQRNDVAGIKSFIKRLQSAGFITPRPKSLGPPEHEAVLAEYERHLAQFSRACAAYRCASVVEARRFLAVTFGHRTPHWSSLGARHLTRHVSLRGSQVAPRTLRDVVGHVC